MNRNPEILKVSKRLAGVFHVIGSPPRIAILIAIGRGEACVCHLEAALGWRQAYISQHLMALRKESVLQDRRDGRFIYYRLADSSILDILLDAARLSGLNPNSLAALIGSRKNASCGCPKCVPPPILPKRRLAGKIK